MKSSRAFLSLLIRVLMLTRLTIIIRERVRPYIPYVKFYLRSRKDIAQAFKEWRAITHRKKSKNNSPIIPDDSSSF